MDVENTLAKARYHLENMKRNEESPTFEFELNSFLSTINSIPEHLLENYNRKYALDIPDDEWLTTSFLAKSKETGNLQAIRFFQWWDSEFQSIKRDPKFSLLIGKRHVSIHRRIVKPDSIEVSAEIALKISSSYRIEVRDKNGRLVDLRESTKPLQKTEEPKITVMYFFQDLPDENIIDLCEIMFTVMEKLLADAVSLFP